MPGHARPSQDGIYRFLLRCIMTTQNSKTDTSAAKAAVRSYAADPGRIDTLSRQIEDGTLSPVDLVQRYLDRMREVEPAVQAWREVAGEAALAAAEPLGDEMRQGRIRGPDRKSVV